MNIIKCKNGHFYDSDRFMLCPHCGAEALISKAETSKSLFHKEKRGTIPKEKKRDHISKEKNFDNDNNTFGISFTPEIKKETDNDAIINQAQDYRDNNVPPKIKDTDILLNDGIQYEEDKEKGGLSLKEAVEKVAASGDEKTVGFFSSNQSETEKLVVGWIICIDGKHFGNSFCICDGRNSVGRSDNNDIVLKKDNTVSREKQLWIVYEPKKREFFVQPGESSRLSYINDEGIMQIQKMKRNDVLEIGEGKYIFIPLCDEGFFWENYIEKTE